MVTFGATIAGLWIIFLAYWLVSAAGAKPSAPGTGRGGGVALRLLIVVAIIALTRAFSYRVLPRIPFATGHGSMLEASLGVGLCALGIAIAIWARVYLGKNWGMPMSLREGHELVTSGPYAFVRHPIYTGILLAVVGTTLVQGLSGVVVLAVIFAYFTYAAKAEERSMKVQFPDVYPAYMRRTKMLIPLVF